MSNVLKPDICVIGGGSGGLSVAAAAASFGVPVVLIEKGRMGGDCLNYGCVPSKAMIAAGKHAEAMRHGEKFGIANSDPQIDFRAVNAHVHSVIASIAPNDSVERFTALGVHVIQAEARFQDARTVVAGDVEIRARALALCVAEASVEEIDCLDILQATLLAMQRAVQGLRLPPRHVLVDGNRLPVLAQPATAVVGGDATVAAISAASILAKVHRDRLCEGLHAEWPQYGFAQHKGYPTAAHLAALRAHGACTAHRRSFAPVRALPAPDAAEPT